MKIVRAIPVIALLAIALILFVTPYSFALPDSSCFGSTNISGTGTFAVSCTLTSILGDYILVGVGQGSNVAQSGGLFLIGTPTDGQNGYGVSVPQTTDSVSAGGPFGEIEMFNTTATTSGSLTVSSSCRQANGGGGADFCDMWVQEVPKITGTVQTARGSCRNTVTPNCPIHTNSTITPSNGDFLFAVSVAQLSPLPTITAGSHYTLLAGQNSSGGTFFVHSAENSINWAFGSTNAPFGSSSAGGTVQTVAEGLIDVPNTFTTTKTITGWLFPNFANCTPTTPCADSSLSWFIGFLIMLIPLAMVDYVFASGSLNIDRNVIVFINLAMLFLGALLATMVNQLPFAIPFVFGMVLVIYIWRGRG